MIMRVRVLMTVVTVGALAAAGSAAAGEPPPGEPRLPDLVADAAEKPRFEVEGRGASRRLLLRFDGFVHNAGPGALEIRGRNRQGRRMDAVQRAFAPDGSFVDLPPRDPANPPSLDYETDDGHDHWHVHAMARYALVTEDRSTPVTAAPKAGFCLLDSQRVGAGGPFDAVYTRYCERRNPGAESVVQGVSAGWRDLYDGDLQFQWVNASWVAPGAYRLRAEADPDDVVTEVEESNRPAFTDRTIAVPGHRARPLTVRTAPGRPARIRLRADRFGAAGPRRFRVVSRPGNGTLSRRVGRVFASPVIVYRPRRGFTGLDTFSYAASDAVSPFPRVPVLATVSVRVGPSPAPRLAIGGLAAKVRAGRGMQLTVTTRDLPDDTATWTVNGVPGGDGTVGTISPTGVYRAPARVPEKPVVVVRATSVHDTAAFSERPVRIARPERNIDAVLVMSKPRLSLAAGRRLVARVGVGARGRLRITARAGARRLRGCTVRRTVRFRTYTCRVVVPRGVSRRSVRLTATLSSGRLVLARRIFALPRN
jgi:hypothetical protein